MAANPEPKLGPNQRTSRIAGPISSLGALGSNRMAANVVGYAGADPEIEMTNPMRLRIRDQTRLQSGAAVWGQLRDPVWEGVYQQIRQQVDRLVRNPVRDLIEEQAGSQP